MSGPTIVVAPPPNETPFGVSAGTQSVSTGTLVLSNSNGISFGMSGSSRITASYTVPTETPFGLSAGTQSVSTGTLVFSNSNNVTFGMSGSSRVTASASFAAETPFGVSAGTQSVSTGTLVFSDSNGISFGMSGSSRITASYTVPTETPFGVSAGTQSVSTGTLVFSNSNRMTFGMSGSSRITVDYQGVNISAGTTSNDFELLVFSNSNNISFGLNGSTVTASGANTASTFKAGLSDFGNTSGTTGQVQNNIWFAGINNITMSQSVNGQSATLTISGPTGGGMGVSTDGNTAGSTGTVGAQVVFVGANGVSLSQSTAAGGSATITIADEAQATFAKFNPYPGFWAYMGSQAMNSSLFIQPFRVDGMLTATHGNLHFSNALSTSSNSSFAVALSLSMGIYTSNGQTLSLATSGTKLYQFTITGSTSSGSWQGWREYSIPITLTATPGAYWMGILAGSGTTNTNWGNSGLAQIVIQAGNSQFSGAASAASNASAQALQGLGTYSAATAALPASIPFSVIRGAGAAIYRSVPYWNIGN